MEGLSPTREVAKNRLPLSRELAKEIFKTEVKSCSDPGNCQTGWGLWPAEAGIRNTERHWKAWSMTAAICSTHPSLDIPLYDISCKHRWPQGRLWRQSTTGTPFSSTFAWQWKQQDGRTVFWADVCGYHAVWAPSPPAWHHEERLQRAAQLKCPLVL